MEKKRKRALYRSVFLIVSFSIIGITIYLSSFIEDKNALSTVGDPAPNFIGKTLTGEKLELKEHATEKTLINFWGTWCEPCKREMPALENVYSQYKDEGFSIVSVNLGQSNFVVEQFIEQYNLSFPVIIDKDKSIRQAYYVGNLPVSFLINSEGEIIKVHEGELSEKMLEEWINL
ncbi:MAG: thiol-disulfide oxidoreductase ResA [Lysinibacillus sp.]|nr:thiol-disulfide oxidoreductase ResA [Lysinibacillus sp.]